MGLIFVTLSHKLTSVFQVPMISMRSLHFSDFRRMGSSMVNLADIEMKSCAQKYLSSVTKGLNVCPVGED